MAIYQINMQCWNVLTKNVWNYFHELIDLNIELKPFLIAPVTKPRDR